MLELRFFPTTYISITKIKYSIVNQKSKCRYSQLSKQKFSRLNSANLVAECIKGIELETHHEGKSNANCQC